MKIINIDEKNINDKKYIKLYVNYDQLQNSISKYDLKINAR